MKDPVHNYDISLIRRGSWTVHVTAILFELYIVEYLGVQEKLKMVFSYAECRSFSVCWVFSLHSTSEPFFRCNYQDYF